MEKNVRISQKFTLKPFVKWVGGKSQLLKDIRSEYPEGLGEKYTKYAESFVGGGAIFFDMLNNYKLEELYISDINKELICAYKIIKSDVHNLIGRLKILENEYLRLNEADRKDYYYNIRKSYNDIIFGLKNDELATAAYFIFLNKTCFNGLYRVNSKGLFNVPSGIYKNPLICDEINLVNISNKMQSVEIYCGDYKNCESFVDKNTFVYFDPPYRPITKTAAFTSYSKDGFSDKEQIELAGFIEKLSKKGAKILLSNSDPKNTDKQDSFFDELYSNFNIGRIKAKRAINSDGAGRGEINELLIASR